ncbi:MAG: glucosaminidase domain-containing protein [Thiotrichaceae bacterium]|nr:glucosaminidase domain-containing protein [Thiotrichaceae bacterium]
MNIRKAIFLVLFLPVLGMMSYIGWNLTREHTLPEWELTLAPVNASSAKILDEVFRKLDYHWPLAVDAEVPPIMVDPLPEDLGEVTAVKLKKSLFFRALLPMVLAENAKLNEQRRFLLALFARNELPRAGSEKHQWLEEQLVHYRIKGDINDEVTRAELARRLDEIPVALVLAQAANESAWGSSRFARDAKNLFGEWTYKKGEGLIPNERAEGESHSVRIFPTLRDSVKSYMNNINSGHAYEALRVMREEMRNKQRPLEALKLAGGLLRYSERGEAYVEEIKKMIRSNRLNMLREVTLNLDRDA